MGDDEIKNMPTNSRLLTQQEIKAWIASRKEAGAKIDIGSAELNGWRPPVDDPYDVGRRKPWDAQRHYNESIEEMPHFFVRGPQSRGWVWQGDLSDDKRAIMQARIDERNRKVKEFYAKRRAAGALINIETCECLWLWADELDPYGIELAPYGCVNRVSFVRNKDGDDWIDVVDLTAEKRQALKERGERESSARKHVVDDLFEALRHGGVGLAKALKVIAEAEKTYGERIVKDALSDYQYPWGPIGGLLIERGYLTMEHVTELLRGGPKGPPDIFRLMTIDGSRVVDY
jgi:hypothetical protein